jgi:hypothetical protein
MNCCNVLGLAILLGVSFPVLQAGQALKKNWNPVPVSLWAQVTSVPPGTTGVPQTEVTPSTAPQAPATPAPAPVDTGTPVNPGPSATTEQSTPVIVPSAPPPGVPTVAVPGTTPAQQPVQARGAQITPAVRLPEQTGLPPAPKLPDGCKVTLAVTDVPITHAGGPLTFPVRFVPPTCATEGASTVPWIRRAGADAKSQEYTFTVEANTTKVPREGAIRVGDVSMKVRQGAGKFAIFAAAPSRVEFTAAEKKSAPKQTLAAWSDDPQVAFAAKASAAWLKVTPTARTGKTRAQKFTLELAPAGLSPGRHEGSIEITSPGAVNDPLRIPVVVTISDQR